MNLIYVGDTMCSWCYGFAKSLNELLADPRDAAPLKISLVMGGLRPFTTEAMTPARADELAGHWKRVAEASGQPFATAPNTALHLPGFVYDTEPPSRATVTVRNLRPAAAWPFFEAVSKAFYAEGLDVTRTDVLADIAERLDVPREAFIYAFESDRMREATRVDFEQAKTWGIRGFPTLIAEHDDHLHLVGSGYMPTDTLRERLAAATTPHAH